MKISLEWLKDYIDLEGRTVAEISSTLINLGLEVERIETIEPLSGEVIVGHIAQAVPHPDADRLRICQVDLGESELSQIVCGAANARAGLRVCVARPGAVLPGDLKLKKSKIRGADSLGMILSLEELGLADSSEGIIELPDDVEIGSRVSEYWKLNDFVFDISLTPNRGDCLSYLGIARELAAKWQVKIKHPVLDPAFENKEKLLSKPSLLIADKISCPRFTAARLENISNLSSPPWLYRRLKVSGIRPISLIVDLTNYVLLESGQPLHAYDSDALESTELEVRMAKKGEVLETLDGQKRLLDPSDIVISSQGKVVGLAGVMGGASSQITDSTKNIIIESACFDASAVRKTVKRQSLPSEASHRFERGIDINGCSWANTRAASLILQLATPGSAQAEISLSEIADFFPDPPSEKVIALRTSRAKSILGLPLLESKEAKTALQGLGLVLLDSNEDRTLWQVPHARHDLVQEIDLIEEVGRVIGYDQITANLPIVEMRSGGEDRAITALDRLREATACLNFSETITFPFLSLGELERLGIGTHHPFAQTLRLQNPLSEQENLLQTSLIPALIKAQTSARSRGQLGGRIFQIGRAYFKPHARECLTEKNWHPYFSELLAGDKGWHLTAKAAKEIDRPVERNLLTLICDEIWAKKSWNREKDLPTDFYHIRQVIDDLLGRLGWKKSVQFKNLADHAEDLPFLHPYQSAWIYAAGVPVGFCGKLHPAIYTNESINGHRPLFVAELSLDTLLSKGLTAQKNSDPSFVAASKYPSIDRDLCIMVDDQLMSEEICSILLQCPSSKNLKTVTLLDLYTGERIPEGKKSLTFQLLFQSFEKTLKDEQIAGEFTRLIEYLKSRIDLEFRV